MQFKKWLECLKATGAKSIEELYKKIHAEIRKNPEHAKKAAKQNPSREHKKKYFKKKLSKKQKRENVRKRI